MAAEYVTVGANKFKYKGESWSMEFCSQNYTVQRKHDQATKLYSVSRFFSGVIIEELQKDLTLSDSEELLARYLNPNREDPKLDAIIQRVEVTKMLKVL